MSSAYNVGQCGNGLKKFKEFKRNLSSNNESFLFIRAYVCAYDHLIAYGGLEWQLWKLTHV